MALSQAFYTKLTKISSELGMNPRDLLLVMYAESGVKPSAVNKNGGATGLIQFMPDTLRGLGVPKDQVEDFRNTSAEYQLDYVKKFIQGQMSYAKRSFKSASEYYHANLFPKTLTRWSGSDPIQNANVAIVSKDSPDRRERMAYKANRGLDTNNDGVITVSDMTTTLMRRANENGFQQALANLNSVTGSGQVTEVAKNPDLLKNKGTQVAAISTPTKKQTTSIEDFLESISNWLIGLFPSAKSAVASTNNGFVVSAMGVDTNTKAEYFRILQSVLQEEMRILASIHGDDESVELVCEMPFSHFENQKCLKEVAAAVSEVFKEATREIGGCDVIPIVSSNSYSNYDELDPKTAEINRRKFQLHYQAKKEK